MEVTYDPRYNIGYILVHSLYGYCLRGGHGQDKRQLEYRSVSRRQGLWNRTARCNQATRRRGLSDVRQRNIRHPHGSADRLTSASALQDPLPARLAVLLDRRRW